MAGLLYKRYSESDVRNLSDDSLRAVYDTILKMYFVLLLSVIAATIGVFLPRFVDFGITNFAITFILTLWWLYTMDRRYQSRMLATMLVSSTLFGSTTISLLSSVFAIEERSMVIFFVGLIMLFSFHLCAILTRSIRVVYHFNCFVLPFIIASLIISAYFVSHGDFPFDLLYAIPFVLAVLCVWRILLWFFNDKICSLHTYIPIHMSLLTILSWLSSCHVLYLMGIYVCLLCLFINLKLHTFDAVFSATTCHEHAPGPVSLSLTFYVELLARFSYMFISSG